MKKFAILFISFLSIIVWAAEGNLKVGISTKRPLVGEVVTISLTANSTPKLANMPKIKNAVWLPQYRSSSTSFINGVGRYTINYAFRVEAKGKIKIPELEVQINGKITKIAPFEIVASTAGDKKIDNGDGEDVKLKDIIFGRVEILNLSKEFYVGEEISLEIDLLSWQRVRVQPTSYPKINLDKVVFRDYSRQNRENSRFNIKERSIVSLNQKRFIKQPFETAFRTLSAGTFKTDIKIDTAISLPTQRRNFFGNTVYKQTPYTVSIPFEVKVNPLPKGPEGYDFLGLVGNWDVNFSLKNKKFKVGDPLTLEMTVFGLGTLETLDIPKLEIEGFRSFPPEIDKKSSYDGRERAEIKFVLVPLNKGKKKLEMKVSVFSSILKKYRTFSFDKTIKVAKSDIPAENVNYTKPSPTTSIPVPKYKEKQIIPRSNILFLKTAPNGRVQIPLYMNWIWAYVLLGLLGPLCWFISELSFKRKQKLGSSNALQRRLSAKKRKNKVISAVRKSSDDDLNDVIIHEAVPFINDMLDLPPGTTTSELAGKVKDANLAECMTSVGEASYLPGASNLNKKELRTKLCKALKRLSIILFIFIGFSINAADNEKTITKKILSTIKTEKKAPKLPQSFDEAIHAYDSGNFIEAGKYFRSQIDKDSPDPAMLYNLGTCLCNQGDMAGALVCFERALLLRPYDSAIRENLNFVRRSLFLPESGKIESPTDMMIALCQSLRPDEWLLIVAGAWALAGIFLAFRRKLSINKSIIFVGCCGIIFFAALGAYIFEKTGIYSNTHAVITSSDAELRSLPSESSGSKLVRLRLGTVVNVIESRLGWVRIKTENTKGWMLKDKITRIAPGNELPPDRNNQKRINLKN